MVPVSLLWYVLLLFYSYVFYSFILFEFCIMNIYYFYWKIYNDKIANTPKFKCFSSEQKEFKEQ